VFDLKSRQAFSMGSSGRRLIGPARTATILSPLVKLPRRGIMADLRS